MYFALFSIWRPIKNVVRDCPLAVCDNATIAKGDLVAADHYRETFAGEALYMVHNPDHKWYYLNEQTKDEVLVFKIHDSGDVPAKCRTFNILSARHITDRCI